MPIGGGLAPAGTSLAGYGVVDGLPVPPVPILVDATTGAQQVARKIDPVSGQYVLDANGRIQGMSAVQQLVMLALKTVRDSSALPGFGNPAGQIRLRGSNTAKQLDDAVRLALKDLTDRKTIAINSVDVNPYATNVGEYVVVRWTDLTTNTQQTNTV